MGQNHHTYSCQYMGGFSHRPYDDIRKAEVIRYRRNNGRMMRPNNDGYEYVERFGHTENFNTLLPSVQSAIIVGRAKWALPSLEIEKEIITPTENAFIEAVRKTRAAKEIRRKKDLAAYISFLFAYQPQYRKMMLENAEMKLWMDLNATKQYHVDFIHDVIYPDVLSTHWGLLIIPEELREHASFIMPDQLAVLADLPVPIYVPLDKYHALSVSSEYYKYTRLYVDIEDVAYINGTLISHSQEWFISGRHNFPHVCKEFSIPSPEGNDYRYPKALHPLSSPRDIFTYMSR
jgi:hypothetical protein